MTHAPFTWRGVKFEWCELQSETSRFYVGDTSLGRWVLREHQGGKMWSVSFRGVYLGDWESDRIVALDRARMRALAKAREEVLHLESMPP